MTEDRYEELASQLDAMGDELDAIDARLDKLDAIDSKLESLLTLLQPVTADDPRQLPTHESKPT